MLSGGMFGNLVNKNARAALKEYGDQNGLGVEYEMLVPPVGPPHSPQYSARVRVGESSFDAATAATKRDAKEYAADLALRALTQEPGSYAMYPPGPGSLPGLASEGPFPQHRAPGFRPKYHRPRQQRPKNNQLSAPPDKDPVMLINEYGQKMNLTVKFEDTPCAFPGLYESQVTVGTQVFGPKRSARKKMARKLAAVVGLKELINWEPKEGLYNVNEDPGQLSTLSGMEAGLQGVVLNKDPVMLLNEYCQRSQLKISFEEQQHTEPDKKKSYSCVATVGDRIFESGKGATKNKSKKEAALLALKTLFDMPIEMSTAAKEAKKHIERHPVSLLNEHGQKHNQKVEFQDLGYTGPDHNRTYSFSATVGDRTFDTGHGRSKKEAKKECAKIALGVLLGIPVEPGPVHPGETISSDDGSATPKQPGVKSRVSALYEFCQAYHLPQPEPVEVSPDSRTNPAMHYVTFKVSDLSYEPGQGRTKKAAKEMAAQIALEELEKMHKLSKYSPVGTTEGDQFAALSWNCLSFVSVHAPDSWRLSGHKILAAFIMQDSTNEQGTVVSIGTGNKCIGGDQLRLDGTVVCDSHAEVVARRGLVRFLLTQLDILFKKSPDTQSIFLPKTKGAKIKLREGVTFSLYVSTAPCGDASVFVNESASGESGEQSTSNNKQHGLLRTKVEKGEGTIPLDPDDGIQTIDGIRRGQRLRTASCSDKLAKWNVLGIQGALLSNIIEPIYLSSLVVGSLFDSGHLTRAVSARIEHEGKKPLSTRLPSVYHVNSPKIQCGRLKAHDSPRDVETKSKTKNMSLNWALGDEKHVEVLDACLGRNATGRVPSRLSKMALYVNFIEVAKKGNEYKKVIEAKSYRKAKDQASDYLKAKNLFVQHMKEASYGDWTQMKKPVELNQFA